MTRQSKIQITIKFKKKKKMEGLICLKIQDNNIYLAFSLKYNNHISQDSMSTYTWARLFSFKFPKWKHA